MKDLSDSQKLSAYYSRIWEPRGGGDTPGKTAPDSTPAFQVLNRAIALIDGAIGVRIGVRVGVGDGNPAQGFARYLAWSLATVQPELVEERVVFVGIAMRPAVHGEFENVARRIETARAQHASKLLP